jgi:hypothetical protein
MATHLTMEALQQQIAGLEAELAHLRPIEAAAREAYAFFAGRRPGFAPTCARDMIVGAFEPNTARPRATQAKRARSMHRRKQS